MAGVEDAGEHSRAGESEVPREPELARPDVAAGPSPTAPPSGWRRWRERRRGLGASYWKLWSGSVISNLGDGTSVIAYPWLAATLTRDPVLIAGVAVATRLPWLLFSLPAGAIVDRGDRRRLMVRMNAARALITAAVVAFIVTNTMTIPALYVAALLLGCAEVVYDNAAQTILPRLVPKDRLERANGTLWGAEMIMNQFVGPPLGGFLLALGLAVPFVLDSVTFAASAGLVLLLRGTFRAAPPDSPSAPAGKRTLRQDMREGFGWLWRHDLLRTLAVALGVMNAAGTLAFATFVLFVQEILELGPAGFGILTTAGAIGGVLGSALAPNVTRRIGPGPSLWFTLIAGVVTNLVIALASVPVVVAVMSAAFMFSAVIWNVITVSLRQSIIPDHLLGRVNSVYRFFGWGGMPIGALLGGGIVWLVEPLMGRGAALRAPFIAAAGVHVLIVLTVGRQLGTDRIEAARAEAEAQA